MALKRITPGLTDTTLVTRDAQAYKDVDASFAAKDGTRFPDGIVRGDIYKKIDVRSIDQSIQNIVLTNYFEKPFQPLFGSNLRQLLFENRAEMSEPEVRDLIESSLLIWEPRVTVSNVELIFPGDEKPVPRGIDNIFFFAGSNSDVNSMIVTIHSVIKNTGREIRTTVNMNRLR